MRSTAKRGLTSAAIIIGLLSRSSITQSSEETKSYVKAPGIVYDDFRSLIIKIARFSRTNLYALCRSTVTDVARATRYEELYS